MDKIYLNHIPVSFDRAALLKANNIRTGTDLAEEFLGVVDAAEGH
jgi:hypothetical protein